MATNITFSINGNIKKEPADKIINNLSTKQMFSGSIKCSNKKEEWSTYVFRFVNSETLLYILNELKNDLGEVKVEIQTHDENAKDIQPISIEGL